jgi:hypothetical protein
MSRKVLRSHHHRLAENSDKRADYQCDAHSAQTSNAVQVHNL